MLQFFSLHLHAQKVLLKGTKYANSRLGHSNGAVLRTCFQPLSTFHTDSNFQLCQLQHGKAPTDIAVMKATRRRTRVRSLQKIRGKEYILPRIEWEKASLLPTQISLRRNFSMTLLYPLLTNI